MALRTAEDVVLKKFQPTKFREGYDQVEVDDFLDEVAESMRALVAENEQLKAKLADAEARAAAQPTPAPAPPAQTQAPAPAPPPEPVRPDLSALRVNDQESATGMLALAQKLHDEYVRAGQEEGDQILTDAKAKAAGIIRESEDASVRTLSKLEQDRALLERKIDELRIFERDYRTRLKAYLENLLADVDDKSTQGPEGGWTGGEPARPVGG